MPRLEPVRDIFRNSDSGCGDYDGPKFICCVDGRQPDIHEVWTFGEDGVTLEVHPPACVDVGAFVSDYFATDYLNPTWRRVPMFDRESVNGSVEWLDVPSFLRNDGPPLTLNLLSPYADWGCREFSTSHNLSSGSGGYSEIVSINCNHPARVSPIYHWRIFENTCIAARRARDYL